MTHALPQTIRNIALACAMIALTGCLPEQQQESSAEAPPTPVTTVQATAKDTPITIEFVGKTASSRRVEIRSRVEGFLESRAYDEGALVREGEVMFQMDRKPYEAQLQVAKAELAQQKAKLANAEANLARVQPLADKKAVPQRELDDALGTYRSSAAAVEAAQAKIVQAELDLSYTTIRSPVTGLSSYANEHEGSYIGIGTSSLLTYVAQVDPIWVEFSVSENQILQFKADERSGRIRLPEAEQYEVQIVLADGSVFPDLGRITFANVSLSERTGTFLVRAELPNPPRGDDLEYQLIPGQFVRVRLLGAVRPNAIVVPQRAIQQDAKGSFVWVIDSDGKAQFRPVSVSAWHGDEWFVDEGLEDGETVVVDGALKLHVGASVQVTEPTVEGDQPSGTAEG